MMGLTLWSGSNQVDVYNIIVKNSLDRGLLVWSTVTANFSIENITSYNNLYGFYFKTNPILGVSNCASYDNTTNDYNGTANIAFSKCASSDATGSEAGLQSRTFATDFEDATDFLPTTDGALYGAGATVAVSGHIEYLNDITIVTGDVDIGANGLTRSTPTTTTSTVKTPYLFNIRNKSILPYNIQDDIIKLKISLINGKNSFYTSVSGDLYTNIDNRKISEFSTNDFGITNIELSPSLLSSVGINTCLIWASGKYNTTDIPSSRVRVNFTNPKFGYFNLIDTKTIDGSPEVCVYADDNYVYAGGADIHSYSDDGNGNLTAVSVSDDGGYGQAITSDDNFVYYATAGDGGLHVYDVSSSGTFEQLYYYDVGGSNNSQDVFIHNDFVYLAALASGVIVFDVGSSGVLNYVDSDIQYGKAEGVYVDDDFLYLADNDGLHTYTVSSSGILALLDTHSSSGDQYNDVFVNNGIIYVAAGAYGLYTFSADSSGVLTHLDTNKQSESSAILSVWGDDHYVYAAAGNSGIYSYDSDRNGNLTFVDFDSTATYGNKVHTYNNIVYHGGQTKIITYKIT